MVVNRDSLLNGINESGLSKDQQVKIHNFPDGTSETILKEIDTLVADKPDCINIDVDTNAITNGINSLNSCKKIVKIVKQTFRNTKTVFARKRKRDLDKEIKPSVTGCKTIVLRQITLFGNNFLKYLRSAF